MSILTVTFTVLSIWPFLYIVKRPPKFLIYINHSVFCSIILFLIPFKWYLFCWISNLRGNLHLIELPFYLIFLSFHIRLFFIIFSSYLIQIIASHILLRVVNDFLKVSSFRSFCNDVCIPQSWSLVLVYFFSNFKQSPYFFVSYILTLEWGKPHQTCIFTAGRVCGFPWPPCLA